MRSVIQRTSGGALAARLLAGALALALLGTLGRALALALLGALAGALLLALVAALALAFALALPVAFALALAVLTALALALPAAPAGASVALGGAGGRAGAARGALADVTADAAMPIGTAIAADTLVDGRRRVLHGHRCRLVDGAGPEPLRPKRQRGGHAANRDHYQYNVLVHETLLRIRMKRIGTRRTHRALRAVTPRRVSASFQPDGRLSQACIV